MFVLGGEGHLGPRAAANLAGAVSLRAMCWRKLYCLPFVVFKTLKMHHLTRTRSHMSSRIAHFSSDDVDHLSGTFGKMGREYKSSRGSNHNGFIYNSDDGMLQNGWDDDDDDGNDDDDDDDDDDYELKEEDIWGGHGTNASWDHSYGQKSNTSSTFQSATENGGTTKGSKGRKSWLSMELQALAITGQKKECSGVGFAALEAVQNGGKDSNGGWAPGFSTRKVKIPRYVGGGGGGSGYGNGWQAGAKCAGLPQSAPVSMALWPAKCGYGESAGAADAEDGAGDDDGKCDEDNNEDDDDERGGGRLAPHEIVDREYARSQSTTFSVMEGRGRTLKGMDLRRVRNAVWSRMGFED